MFDSLLLSKDPFRPARVTIRHSSEDDLRDLEPRLSEADYNATLVRFCCEGRTFRYIPYCIFGAMDDAKV